MRKRHRSRAYRARAYRARAGFTLVELLVVITIIGMLTAMVFPAIGQVMETFRKSGCSANLLNIHKACIVYAGSKQVLPVGVTVCNVKESSMYRVAGKSEGTDCMGPNWAALLLQGLDEPALASQLMSCVQAVGNACDECARDEKYNNVGTQFIRVFRCPSSEQLSDDGKMSEWGFQGLAKGNYAGCFGSEFFINEGSGRQAKSGAFKVENVTSRMKAKKVAGGWKVSADDGVKLGVPDGDGKTMMIAEVVGVDSARDGRGAWAWGGMGGSAFTAKLTPNSKENDVIPVCEQNLQPHDKLQCKQKRDSGEVYAASRSAHANSVNIVTMGGTARSISDFVEVEIWRALSTTRGNEKVNVDE